VLTNNLTSTDPDSQFEIAVAGVNAMIFRNQNGTADVLAPNAMNFQDTGTITQLASLTGKTSGCNIDMQGGTLSNCAISMNSGSNLTMIGAGTIDCQTGPISNVGGITMTSGGGNDLDMQLSDIVNGSDITMNGTLNMSTTGVLTNVGALTMKSAGALNMNTGTISNCVISMNSGSNLTMLGAGTIDMQGGNIAQLGASGISALTVANANGTSLSFSAGDGNGTNKDGGDLKFIPGAATGSGDPGSNLFRNSADSATMLETDNTGVGFFGTAPVAQGTSGADLTNNVTSGGTNDQIDDFAASSYGTDAATIRNDIYQLARKLKQVNDALRDYGLLT
jgi:hypothetical protein